MINRVPLCSIVIAAIAFCASAAVYAAAPSPPVREFIETHCFDCHTGEEAEAGLDLARLTAQPSAADDFDRWTRIHDRVRNGEMPPEDASMLEHDERCEFVAEAGQWLADQQRRQYAQFGRVQGRRLTNLQLERTLHELLGIDIPLARQMPADPITAGYSTVADGQPMSHFQLEQHLAVVDAALDEAFRRASDPADEWERTLDAPTIARSGRRLRTREPEMLNGRAVTWSSRLIFYGRLPATTAKESGWYRFTIRASALKGPEEHGVWCTIRTGRCVASAPLLSWMGAFEATAEPSEVTVEGWLPKGHMLEIRPGDGTLKMARFRGGQVGAGEGDPQDVPGVAIEWITMERFHRGPTSDQLRQRLVGSLPDSQADLRGEATIAANEVAEEIAQLLRQFAMRCFRRPVDDTELAPFLAMAERSLEAGNSPLAALRHGYRALLCSPRFLYFHESPGRLSQYAVASRLSYLLWGCMPDAELFRLAAESRLHDEQTLCEQVERMLDDPRGRNFVRDFTAEWLDLRLIDFTEPDRRLYPGFDVIVQQSMLEECHAFFETLLRDDLSVSNLIDSDFTFLNSRLARHYGIDGICGDNLARVDLRADDHRGGMLTQGAILKVTANGTTTSPVIRGVWVSERLLGEHIPPPPAGVPAIEPDIRGAKSIREMLAKHRSDESCSVCHRTIDPPGFALENFDPSGRWRESYTTSRRRNRRLAKPVDASYTLPDGRYFDDLDEFRQLILEDRQKLARNFANQLLTFGTGAPISYADREIVAEIARQAAVTDCGVRSLLKAAVISPLFLNK